MNGTGGDDGEPASGSVGYLSRVGEALINPRASARRMVLAQPTWNEAIMMVVAGYAIAAALLQAIQIGAPELLATPSTQPASDANGEPARTPGLLEKHGLELILALFQFWIVSSLAWFVGVQAGGKATRRQIMGVVGWHTLATAPLAPVLSVAMAVTVQQHASIFAPLILIATGVYVLYIFAAFIAQAHGFKSIPQVMFATFGVSIAVALFFTILASILGAA
ncbi:MAG: YIP1 family protein [Pseudomonadota bacterium]